MADEKELQPNRAERTVLVYRKLDFAGEWEYNFGEFSFRPVEDAAELRVVTEGAAGVLRRRRSSCAADQILPVAEYFRPIM